MKVSSKKLLGLTLMSLTLFSANVACANSNDNLKITLNGKEIKSDVAPFIENNRTLVPIRLVSESLGKKVDWNNETKEVTVSGDKTIKMQIGKKEVLVGNESKELDVPAKIKDSRTFVPIRFVSENLGVNVDWDQATKTVILSNGEKVKDKKETKTSGNITGLVNPGAYIPTFEPGSKETSKIYKGMTQKQAHDKQSKAVHPFIKDREYNGKVPEGMKAIAFLDTESTGTLSIYDMSKIEYGTSPMFVPKDIKTSVDGDIDHNFDGISLDIRRSDLKKIGTIKDLPYDKGTLSARVAANYKSDIPYDLNKETHRLYCNPDENMSVYVTGYNLPIGNQGMIKNNDGNIYIKLASPNIFLDHKDMVFSHNRFVIMNDGYIMNMANTLLVGPTTAYRQDIKEPNYTIEGKTIKYIVDIFDLESNDPVAIVSDANITIPYTDGLF